MNDKFDIGDLQKPDSLAQLVDGISPEIYQSLKTAIELGKWEDGSRLSSEQLESCIQAIILYEAKNIPEEQRTGVDLSAACSSKEAAADFVQPLIVTQGSKDIH